MPQRNIINEDWVRYLQEHDVIESLEEIKKRYNSNESLTLLHTIVPNFQRRIASHNDYKRGDIDCLLSPFGSYGLGGYIRGADIDVVLVCPWIVKRNEFFKFFPELLKLQPTVRDVECIKRTAVPIIKCVIDSISIDISFVRLRGNKLKENIDLLDDSLLVGIDETCLASMDGPRVNKFIKNQIKPAHVQVFRRCLQCIKHWATERDIYNKPSGYLNGSSWTLLLLKIYMSENAKKQDLTITDILKSFFEAWSNWPWPIPVLFTDAIPGKNGERIQYNKLTEFHDTVMPIVSPCYPVCSVAPFVTKSTLKIMTREFQRAELILNTPTDPRSILSKLFNRTNFFKRYDNFICITTSSLTAASHDIWTRKMAFAIPQLLSLLENCPKLKQIQAMIKPDIVIKHYRTLQERRALQNGFTGEDARSMELTSDLNPGIINIIYYFIGVQLEDSCKTVDLTEEIESFLAILDSKKKRNDEDIKWAINSMKKIEVAKLKGINTSNSK